ncbi:MAG: 30S ribosomal protein S16 [bacterium]
MVKLRLTRTGKKHAPQYRVIAIQAKTKRDGKALEYLGYYNPLTKPSTIELKKERIEYWLSQGAVATKSVNNLMIKAKIIVASKTKKVYSIKPGAQATERQKAHAEKAAQVKETKTKPVSEKTEKIETPAPVTEAIKE